MAKLATKLKNRKEEKVLCKAMQEGKKSRHLTAKKVIEFIKKLKSAS